MASRRSAAPLALYMCLVVQWGAGANFSEINLPPEHIPYYFNSYSQVAEQCRLDNSCPYKVSSVVYFKPAHFQTSFSHGATCSDQVPSQQPISPNVTSTSDEEGSNEVKLGTAHIPLITGDSFLIIRIAHVSK